jgi:hypothetical protein
MPVKELEDPFVSDRLTVRSEGGLADGVGSLRNLGVLEWEPAVRGLEEELSERPFLDRSELLLLLIGLSYSESAVYPSI